ncbi:MAG: hypothetical protein N2D54_03060, partial [Chloroflexota bacterium]
METNVLPIRLINLGQVPSWQTQAYYHAVAELTQVDTVDTIILCQPDSPYLCLGYHQSFEAIFDKEECERENLPVYRRRVGGGATYLDSNQFFYQCIFYHKRAPLFFKDVYAEMLAAPIATLKRLGLNSELRAINEVEAEGRRIAGIGGGRIGDAAVVVGKFLFDFNYAVMAKVWQVPWEPFRKMAATALQERVTTLTSLLDQVNIKEVEEILIEEYAKTLQRPLILGEFTPEEKELAEEI